MSQWWPKTWSDSQEGPILPWLASVARPAVLTMSISSYQAAIASKLKAKKGQDPDYPNPWQALASPDAEAWML